MCKKCLEQLESNKLKVLKSMNDNIELIYKQLVEKGGAEMEKQGVCIPLTVNFLLGVLGEVVNNCANSIVHPIYNYEQFKDNIPLLIGSERTADAMVKILTGATAETKHILKNYRALRKEEKKK